MAADRHQAQAYPLRLPEDLKARIAGSAAEQGRSLNAEIVARLTASFDLPHTKMDKVELVRLVNDAIDERIERMTDATIIRREPKQPVVSQGPRKR